MTISMSWMRAFRRSGSGWLLRSRDSREISTSFPRSFSGLTLRGRSSRPLTFIVSPQRRIQLGWLLGPPPEPGSKAALLRNSFWLGVIASVVLGASLYKGMVQWQLWDSDGHWQPKIKLLSEEQAEAEQILKEGKIQMVLSDLNSTNSSRSSS